MAREDLTPAEKVLYDDPYTSSTDALFRSSCYICTDPDFARMGLPLCRTCSDCQGHVPADDTVCSDCGVDEYEEHMRENGDDGSV